MYLIQGEKAPYCTARHELKTPDAAMYCLQTLKTTKTDCTNKRERFNNIKTTLKMLNNMQTETTHKSTRNITKPNNNKRSRINRYINNPMSRER